MLPITYSFLYIEKSSEFKDILKQEKTTVASGRMEGWVHHHIFLKSARYNIMSFTIRAYQTNIKVILCSDFYLKNELSASKARKFHMDFTE